MSSHGSCDRPCHRYLNYSMQSTQTLNTKLLLQQSSMPGALLEVEPLMEIGTEVMSLREAVPLQAAWQKQQSMVVC